MTAAIENPLESVGLQAPVQHQIEPNRKALVTGEYIQRVQHGEHGANDLQAVVTMNGEPIEQGGETLTLGLVPVERRYAIAPVIGGTAEVLGQDDFERAHLHWYLACYAHAGHPPDDADKRPIPNVRDFVSHKVNAQDASRLVPLGTGMAEKGERNAFWSEARQDTVPADEVNDERDNRIAELEAKLNALAEAGAVAPTPAVVAEAKPEKPKELCPNGCGSEYTAGYFKSHERHCKGPQEAA